MPKEDYYKEIFLNLNNVEQGKETHKSLQDIYEEDTPFEDIPKDPRIAAGIYDYSCIPILSYYIEKGLKGHALLAYALICSVVVFSDSHVFRMGQNRIALWLGCSPRKANKTINDLADNGFIMCIYKPKEHKGEKKESQTNEYVLPAMEFPIVENLLKMATLTSKTYYRKQYPKKYYAQNNAVFREYYNENGDLVQEMTFKNRE